MRTQRQRIEELAQARGFLRGRDIEPKGIDRTYLAKLAAIGALERIGRGLYALPGATPPTQHRNLVEIAAQSPNVVICLLSALAFHEIGTQLPPAVWIAIGGKARAPRATSIPLEIVRMSAPLLREGVEAHTLEGVRVGITDPARTIVDLFKFRSRVGLDVALEALKDGALRRRFTWDDVYRYATMERMWRVIEPYAESLP